MVPASQETKVPVSQETMVLTLQGIMELVLLETMELAWQEIEEAIILEMEEHFLNCWLLSLLQITQMQAMDYDAWKELMDYLYEEALNYELHSFLYFFLYSMISYCYFFLMECLHLHLVHSKVLPFVCTCHHFSWVK